MSSGVVVSQPVSQGIAKSVQRDCFGLLSQRELRRGDNIRLRQVLGDAEANSVTPILVISSGR